MAVQDVQVKNTAANPVVSRGQDNPARQPFQQVVMSDPAFPSAPQSFAVPAGKCLVVECVSGYVNMPTGGKVSDLSLQTTVGSQSVPHRLPVTLMLSAGGTDRYVTCQMLRVYASPGTTVAYGLGTSGASAQSSTLTISGHLVDVL
jgi:hypothetical protein